MLIFCAKIPKATEIFINMNGIVSTFPKAYNNIPENAISTKSKIKAYEILFLFFNVIIDSFISY